MGLDVSSELHVSRTLPCAKVGSLHDAAKSQGIHSLKTCVGGGRGVC